MIKVVLPDAFASVDTSETVQAFVCRQKNVTVPSVMLTTASTARESSAAVTLSTLRGVIHAVSNVGCLGSRCIRAPQCTKGVSVFPDGSGMPSRASVFQTTSVML